jgi:hypothetical protein
MLAIKQIMPAFSGIVFAEALKEIIVLPTWDFVAPKI